MIFIFIYLQILDYKCCSNCIQGCLLLFIQYSLWVTKLLAHLAPLNKTKFILHYIYSQLTKIYNTIFADKTNQLYHLTTYLFITKQSKQKLSENRVQRPVAEHTNHCSYALKIRWSLHYLIAHKTSPPPTIFAAVTTDNQPTAENSQPARLHNATSFYRNNNPTEKVFNYKSVLWWIIKRWQQVPITVAAICSPGRRITWAFQLTRWAWIVLILQSTTPLVRVEIYLRCAMQSTLACFDAVEYLTGWVFFIVLLLQQPW